MTCQHNDCEVKKMTSGPHWGKLICSDCGKFIKWLSDPEKLNYTERCALLCEIAGDLLDIGFVESVVSQFEEKRFLSNKQYAVLKEICEDNNLDYKIKQYNL
jgi:hypothetical protein